MDADSLKVSQNEDGTFTLEWDNEDPRWSFLNNMTSKEIQTIVEQAVDAALLNEEEGLDGPV
tara:strand:+ start:563 stop:748 length:186 start_codon:yes stop_codon:yes gene_type:complete